MRNYIIFNDFNTEKFALIEELPIVNKAERDIEFIEIDGRHGFLTLDKKRFLPIDYEVDLIFKDKQSTDIIKQVFNGSGKLILSNEPNRYYKAVVQNVITFERQTRNVYICRISFKLQPFGYEIKNNEIASITNPYTISNNTNATCQPLITIQGSGSCILTIGNHQINITDINESIILDFEMQEAYKNNNGSKENMNGKVDGVFYDFEIGNTKISWNGSGVTKITVNPRYRWR